MGFPKTVREVQERFPDEEARSMPPIRLPLRSPLAPVRPTSAPFGLGVRPRRLAPGWRIEAGWTPVLPQGPVIL